MSSVTERIKQVKQPRGGYVKPSQLHKTVLDDGKTLHMSDSVHASITGMAVDYLSRLMRGSSVDEAFHISMMGAERAEMLGMRGAKRECAGYLSKVKGLDNQSIICACKACAFDVWFRNPIAAMMAKTPADTMPDNNAVEDIRTLVERSLTFFNTYGPVTEDGFTFEPNGYTSVVDSGDGDFLTNDTLWDFKTSKAAPTSKHTLQILMYYVMGKKSGKAMFKNIQNVGIFNPILNAVYLLPVSSVPVDVMDTIEHDVCGF